MRCRTPAIPVRVIDYSDTSQVVTLYTREAGVVDGIAKGSHRPRSSFRGPFDLAVLCEVVYVPSRGEALAILTESDVIDGYRGLRSSWRRHVAAGHVLEVLRAAGTAGEPCHELFDLARATFERASLQDERLIPLVVLHFDLRALRILGFLGSVDSCVSCRRPWPGMSRGAYFSPQSGGLLCRECYPRRSRSAASLLLPGSAVQALQRLAAASLLEDAPAVEAPALGQTLAIVLRSAEAFLERPLHALEREAHWLFDPGTVT